MTRIALTGASGFVGRATLHRLKAIGVDTVVLGRPELADFSRLRSQLRGCDGVINAAGLAHGKSQSLEAMNAVNHDLVRNLALCCSDAGVPLFVQVSSIAVHGVIATVAPITEMTPVRPTTPYGVSKARAEEELQSLSIRHDMRMVVLRPPLVCGAGAPGNLATLRRALALGTPLPRIETNRRDLIGVRNLAMILVAAATNKPDQRYLAFPVSDGRPVSTQAILVGMASGLKKQPVTVPLPLPLLRMASGLPLVGRPLQQLTESLEVEGNLAWHRYSLEPQFTTMEELVHTGSGDNLP